MSDIVSSDSFGKALNLNYYLKKSDLILLARTVPL